jgi:hypothetical protein
METLLFFQQEVLPAFTKGLRVRTSRSDCRGTRILKDGRRWWEELPGEVYKNGWPLSAPAL